MIDSETWIEFWQQDRRMIYIDGRMQKFWSFAWLFDCTDFPPLLKRYNVYKHGKNLFLRESFCASICNIGWEKLTFSHTNPNTHQSTYAHIWFGKIQYTFTPKFDHHSVIYAVKVRSFLLWLCATYHMTHRSCW